MKKTVLTNVPCSMKFLFSQAIITTVISSIVILSPGPASAQEKPPLTAVRTTTPIKLDGRLDEPSWQTATPVTDFTQRELAEGEPATEKTEIRIVYDEDNLYIGVICHDSEPDKIVHHELMYDNDLLGDDNLTVVLDTFNAQRSGYAFRINPNGARFDALVKDVESLNSDWNGIWDAAAQVTENGWTAEIVIPFLGIRFPTDENQEWGINFRRIIRRKNEEVLWTAWKRDDGIQQLSKAGKLVGLSDIKRGKRTEFKPYILGGIEKEENQDIDTTFKYGIDVKYPLSSDLTLDFTTKTDFAQVESDKEQINLTRFNLQYPEKRDFFLEGAGIFDCTQGFDTMLYYSRRIGITPDPDREQVPILGGIKLSGKSGSYNIGIMTMQTDEKTVYETGEDSTVTKKVYPSTNFTVVRVKKDVLRQSYIGFIGTSVNKREKADVPLTGTDRVEIHYKVYLY